MCLLPACYSPAASFYTFDTPSCRKPGRSAGDLFEGITCHTIQNFVYSTTMIPFKQIKFRGSALDDLRAFPNTARRDAGFQPDQVQRGRSPDDWKPMPTIGSGVNEIRIRETSGAYRVIYVAKFADTVYVLHCFHKKTQKTSRPDLTLAESRYRELVEELSNERR